jgi:predicted DNA-binding transcriptional regulator AlpA
MNYSVTLAVRTDVQLDDDTARDVAARWAAAANLDLGMTSTSRDEPWLRVSGLTAGWTAADDLAQHAGEQLRAALRDAGAVVREWEAVEVISEAEMRRRAQRPAIPPMVNAEQFAELTGLTRQRIYQYLSDRRAGKRDDFPEQVPGVDGYWLRSVAEHWARTRRRQPGPAPRTTQ